MGIIFVKESLCEPHSVRKNEEAPKIFGASSERGGQSTDQRLFRQRSGQVGFRRGDGRNVEFVYQDLQYTGGNERRQ